MKFRRRSRRSHCQRRGATAVEFAFAAPALFFVIFCCAEFARLSMMRNLANNAAYEAARCAIVEGADNEDAILMANKILGRLGAQNTTINIIIFNRNITSILIIHLFRFIDFFLFHSFNKIKCNNLSSLQIKGI